MKRIYFVLLLWCQWLIWAACDDTSYYNSREARADLEAAQAQYRVDPLQVNDSALRQAADFFELHAMDEELVRVLLLEAAVRKERAQVDEARQRLLYAASVAEGGGDEALKADVYAALQALFPADTSLVRLALQTQQQYVERRMERDAAWSFDNVVNFLAVLLMFVGIYLTHQRLQIKMQNARITALRLELQSRDNTEQEGLAHLREDEAVMMFRTAFADRHTVTPADWAALHDAYTRHYPKFERRLKDLHSLSEVEWQVCMLLRLDFPLADIATFTLRTPAAISTVRSRLYSKFFLTKGSASDWDKFIQTL